MSIEEYLRVVTEQIRCRQAREAIREEMKGHLEDQMEECMKSGMGREEAEASAVRQMGDPIEAGVSLDRVHRPKTAWGMFVFIAILSMAGAGVQYFISIHCENTQGFSLISHLVYMTVGFAVMAEMYYLDYSFFGTYGKYMAIGFLAFMFLEVFFLGQVVNGAVVYAGGMNFSLRMVMICFVPLFGGVLYSYRGQGWKGILKSMIFLMIPVWLTWRMPCLSLALLLFFTLMIMLSVAIMKGWFGGRGKKFLSVIWSMVVVCPPLLLWAGCRFGMFQEYQIARLESLINRDEPMGKDYVYYRIREILNNAKFLGHREETADISAILPEINTDFIITHLISYYGILSGIVIFALFIFLVFKIFHISAKQKNQLGMMIGIGCGSIFALQILIYFAENIGLLPYSYVYLPLFSTGGTGMVVTYFLLGIVLSIYKYQDIPLKVKKKELIIKI